MENFHYCAANYHSHCTLSACTVSKIVHNGDTENSNNFKAITCLVFKDTFIYKMSGEGGRGTMDKEMCFIWLNYKHLNMPFLQLLKELK